MELGIGETEKERTEGINRTAGCGCGAFMQVKLCYQSGWGGQEMRGWRRFAEFFSRCFLDLTLAIKNLKKKKKKKPKTPQSHCTNTLTPLSSLCRLSLLKTHLHSDQTCDSLQTRCWFCVSLSIFSFEISNNTNRVAIFGIVKWSIRTLPLAPTLSYHDLLFLCPSINGYQLTPWPHHLSQSLYFVVYMPCRVGSFQSRGWNH